MIIVSLDPSLSSTGFIVYDSRFNIILHNGYIKTTDVFSTNERCKIICNSIKQLIDETVYTTSELMVRIVKEASPSYCPSAIAVKRLAQLDGYINGYFSGYEIQDINPKDVKKTIAKVSNLPVNSKLTRNEWKKLSIKWYNTITGIDTKNDDESDAYWILKTSQNF